MDWAKTKRDTIFTHKIWQQIQWWHLFEAGGLQWPPIRGPFTNLEIIEAKTKCDTIFLLKFIGKSNSDIHLKLGAHHGPH